MLRALILILSLCLAQHAAGSQRDMLHKKDAKAPPDTYMRQLQHPPAAPRARPGVVFGRGPVECTAARPAVKANITTCQYWAGYFQTGGICQVSLETTEGHKQDYITILRLDFKEHRPARIGPPSAMSFAYKGIECRVKDDRISQIYACREYDEGATKQCTLCVKTPDKEACYFALLSILKDDPPPAEAEEEEGPGPMQEDVPEKNGE